MPVLAHRVKKVRRKLGVLSPRVVIRRQLPGYYQALFLALFSALMLGVGWAGALFFARGEGEVALRGRLDALQDELVKLRSMAGVGVNAIGIERATHQQLLQKISALEIENATLKEDMRLFERLIPRVSEGVLLGVENFRVTKGPDGRFRYRMLVVFQSGKQQQDFRGRLQLIIAYELNGVQSQIRLPADAKGADRFQFEVRNILRMEGAFDIPQAANLLSVEARLLQGDAIKSKQLAQILGE